VSGRAFCDESEEAPGDLAGLQGIQAAGLDSLSSSWLEDPSVGEAGASMSDWVSEGGECPHEGSRVGSSSSSSCRTFLLQHRRAVGRRGGRMRLPILIVGLTRRSGAFGRGRGLVTCHG
jgi:hypothetical protein